MTLLKLIRFPNLIIVVLTQYLLQYFILVPALTKAELTPTLPYFPFSLLVLSTVLIAAGGYIINDIEDWQIDAINKPNKQIVGKSMTIASAYIYYAAFGILGLLISLYLAFYIHDLLQLLIYPTAVAILWAYSKYFKKTILIGNFIVSIFCAFVAGVIWYAERDNFRILLAKAPTEAGLVSQIFTNYLIFAFLTTLFREIIKDIEDTEGDKLNGCKTLPIVSGVKTAKTIAFGVTLIFLLFIAHLTIQETYANRYLQLFIFSTTISAPALYTIYTLTKAKTKQEYKNLSALAKVIMLSGLIYILFINL